MSIEERNRLAWHETLEVHELVAFQSIGLMKLKMSLKKITDPHLKSIYRAVISDLELNLRELIQFYPSAPVGAHREPNPADLTGFYAGDLLGLSKALVRNLAIGITETATPVLRETLTTHLLRAIKGHEMTYNYMYQKGLYPSYDLPELLKNDLNNAKRALEMRSE
ncbi:spore coat protein [Siminovitchia sediminis]|uniref:Spore coat protein n=1 Tax=Siminovitchia sediminis TaxID=1274353 RepID=A0ABW4KNC4_9BACI